MKFALVLYVCLIGQPPELSCRETHLTYLGNVPMPAACFKIGLPAIIKWKRFHPNWQLKKFWCRPVNDDNHKVHI